MRAKGEEATSTTAVIINGCMHRSEVIAGLNGALVHTPVTNGDSDDESVQPIEGNDPHRRAIAEIHGANGSKSVITFENDVDCFGIRNFRGARSRGRRGPTTFRVSGSRVTTLDKCALNPSGQGSVACARARMEQVLNQDATWATWGC